MSANMQLERTVIRQHVRAHVRHFIMYTRRAGHFVTPPLNCGVMRLNATEAALLIGAIAFAGVCAVRPLLLGLAPLLVVIEFLLPAFALFCALSVVLRAFSVRRVWFCLCLAALAPVLSVISPIYLNLKQANWEEYVTTYDFATVVRIALFALVGAVLAGPLTLIVERQLAWGKQSARPNVMPNA